jgi:phosphoribosylanthranilate isomerase
MPLRTLVKVGNISNLNDARYCSGMGVDMLGFSVIDGQRAYVNPKLFQEIRGWIPGPKIVAEIYGLKSPAEITDVIQNYVPDYLELSFSEYMSYNEYFTLPCIVAVRQEELSGIKSSLQNIAFLQLEDYSPKSKFEDKRYPYPVLLKFNNASDILEKSDLFQGFALDSFPETPNIDKGHYDLSEILEQLEEF